MQLLISRYTKTLFFCILLNLLVIVSFGQKIAPGVTTITKWQHDKNGAVSITYDDASRNQFLKALPVMEKLKMPATFFVITGPIKGSKYHGKFIGRPVKEIISESATVPTNDANFLERCSAAGYLGYVGTISYHTRAGGMYDSGDKQHAFKLMDSLYSKVRHGDFKPGYEPCPEYKQAIGTTWDDLKKDAAEGYEIASHSITHATMPGMNEANIKYELEKSKEEILTHLGPKYTFSCEVPYGYENERVMKIAYPIYPAFRNRMPEAWLKEIDRAKKETPGNTDKDYIQWQRGATTKTPMTLMKSWVDTVVNKNNTWLVLVFHGIDGMGYEALPSTMLDQYFRYIKSKNAQLWVATFGDVTKYMREREHSKLSARKTSNRISIILTGSLDKNVYDLPLTLKTYIPSDWKKVKVSQRKHTLESPVKTDNKGNYVLYQAKPNYGSITLTKI